MTHSGFAQYRLGGPSSDWARYGFILNSEVRHHVDPPTNYYAVKEAQARSAFTNQPPPVALSSNQLAEMKVASEKKKTELSLKALKFNQDAADRGDAYGLFRMGERYRDGDAVPKDLAKARSYFERSAQSGNSSAALALQN